MHNAKYIDLKPTAVWEETMPPVLSAKEVDSRNPFDFLIYSAGSGEFREGLRRAGGFTCVGHCEVDAYADKKLPIAVRHRRGVVL